MTCCIISEDDGERLLRWLESAIGRELVLRERQCVEEMFANVYGCYLLQLGWGRTFSTPAVKGQMQHRIILEECFSLMGGVGKVLGKQEAMPIATNSMDAIFMPHTLEFSNNPIRVLKEVDRVLISGGHLILLGFNPWSIWGVGKLIFWHSHSIPWCAKFLRPQRVINWLTTHGFQIEQRQSIIFLPPLRQAYLLRRLRRIEPIAAYCLPSNGAVYIIKAIKRTPALIPPEPMIACDSEPFAIPAFSSTVYEDGQFSIPNKKNFQH